MVERSERSNALDAKSGDFDIAAASRECAEEAFEIVSGIMRKSDDEGAQISAAKTIVGWAKDGQKPEKKADASRDGITYLAGLGKSQTERGALAGAPGSIRNGSNGSGPSAVADQSPSGRGEK